MILKIGDWELGARIGLGDEDWGIDGLEWE